MQVADLGLDGVSLAAICFLAAIGLAITFGVMRVINMAHGEFLTLGAYTGYVVPQWVPNYTASILIALLLAFAVTFAAGGGGGIERLAIIHLYKKPPESLLATFGISIALQQLLKNIFGTQARPLTAPAWLDGALTCNDVVAISYIRITILVTFGSQACGVGFVSTSFVKTLGKTLCLCLAALAMDLIWGYAGTLSLGHMAFFALGGYIIGMLLMYARTEEIVVAVMAQDALPATAAEIQQGIARQIFGVVGSSDLPLVWPLPIHCRSSWRWWFWCRGSWR
jgi:branched-subunit amino acid ABC-type transport system permease component